MSFGKVRLLIGALFCDVCLLALLVRTRVGLLLLPLPRTLIVLVPALLAIVELLTVRAFCLPFILAVGVIVVISPAIIAVSLLAGTRSPSVRARGAGGLVGVLASQCFLFLLGFY